MATQFTTYLSGLGFFQYTLFHDVLQKCGRWFTYAKAQCARGSVVAGILKTLIETKVSLLNNSVARPRHDLPS